MMVLRTALGVCVVFGLAILIFPSPGCLPPQEDPVPCDPDLGVCPPPEPGIVLDEVGLTKSVWFEEARVGEPEELKPTICRADLDANAGEEVVFRGRDGLAVIAVERGQPIARGVITPKNTQITDFLDVDLDGNFEYFATDFFEELYVLFDHDGEPIWRSPGDIDRLRHVKFADVDSDGTLEFGARTDDGIAIFDAVGTVLYHIPGKRFSSLSFGEFDGDGMLEVVTKSAGGLIESWRLDSTRLGSFPTPAAYWGVVIDRLPGDETRDYIRIKCELFDIDGTEVGRLDGNSSAPCGFDGVDYAESFTTVGSCDTADGEAETLHVRFVADRDPFRVEPSHSIDSMVVLCGSNMHATRTILRIFDPDDKLVYHEVLESQSAPGSITVIPSDVEGEEILLVADDTRILAYRIRPAGAIE